LLFSTGVAATAKDNLRNEVLQPPHPPIINTRVITPGHGRRRAAGVAAVAAVSALSLFALSVFAGYVRRDA